MLNSTTKTYILKREILNFSNKISRTLSKPERKFTADMIYGMLAGGSCLLTDIVDQLHEPSKKINVVDRLSRHLAEGTSQDALHSYLMLVKKWCPNQPVIHIDDSDIVKPDGYKFESLGRVRDGSESTNKKSVYQKGYQVMEATVLTKNNHPVSIFSKIYSSSQKDFVSSNHETFSAMEWGKTLFGKATFVMDRGYDDNKMNVAWNPFLFTCPGKYSVCHKAVANIPITCPFKVLSVYPFDDYCLSRLNDKVSIIILRVSKESIMIDLHLAGLVSEL